MPTKKREEEREGKAVGSYVQERKGVTTGSEKERPHVINPGLRDETVSGCEAICAARGDERRKTGDSQKRNGKKNDPRRGERRMKKGKGKAHSILKGTRRKAKDG